MADGNEFEKIEEATDMYALVSSYGISLEKAGKNYKGLCPFHNEKTPSFFVSNEKKLASCFGCHKGGRPINFIMQIEGIEFLDAAEKLAKFNGMEFKRTGGSRKEAISDKYYKIMNTARDFYVTNLLRTEDGKAALNYLSARGLDEDTIKEFQIGLAPKTGNALYNVLKDLNYNDLDMSDLSLVDKGKNGYYDLFNNRITFPICDEFGNTLGFSGRIYDTKEGAKYWNSRDTLIFKKGEQLFNLNLAKSDILKKNRVILHEGQMDVIATYRAGLKEVVCSLGTGLTEAHVKKLRRFTTNVIICYDADSAGVNASIRAIRMFKKEGFSVHLVSMQGAKDSDEFVLKNGAEAYRDFFENSIVDASEYIFNAALQGADLNDSVARESIKQRVFEMLEDSASATEREEYLRRLSQVLGVSREALGEDYSHYAGNTGYDVPSSSDDYSSSDDSDYVMPQAQQSVRPTALHEMRLFRYGVSGRERALDIENRIQDNLGALSAEAQELWGVLIYSFYENYKVFNETLFVKMLSQEQLNYYLSVKEILSKDKTPYNDEDMNECIEKLGDVSIRKDNEAINKKLNSDISDEERLALLQQKFANRKKQNQLEKNRRKN